MDRLTKYDMDAIMARRERFARYCQRKDLAANEVFLMNWANSKNRFLGDLFGDKLILQTPFSYEAKYDDLITDMDNKLNYDDEIVDFYREFRNKFFDCFFEADMNLRANINLEWFEPERLVNNRQDFDDFEITSNAGKKFKFQKGSKIIRNIRKIAKYIEVDNELLENFINVHSQVLNQKHITGTLCLSIHPLDYMTMSDNREGWDSCMSWDEDGCYRAGTLEMMNSDYVVVAYLSSDREYFLDRNHDFPWNSKKWRTLVLVTPDLVSTIKSYPFSNYDLEKFIANKFREKLINKTGKEFSPVIKYGAEREHYFDIVAPYPEDPEASENFRVRYVTDMMYNDFGCCKHFGSFCMTMPSRVNINYSGSVSCICCGCSEVENEESLYCDYCDGNVYCRHCGDSIPIDEAIEHDGDYYCQCCYDDRCLESMLDECERVWEDDAEKVYIDFPDRKFNVGYLYYGYVDSCDITSGRLEREFGPLHIVEDQTYYHTRRFYAVWYDQIPNYTLERLTGMDQATYYGMMADKNEYY